MTLLLLSSLSMGQGCLGPAPSPPPSSPSSTISSCGLSATACVPVAGSSPYTLAPADLDADGDVDLAVANFGTDDVSVLLNNGDATFTAAGANLAVGDSPATVLAGDWDGDGDADLAATGGFFVSIFLNDGRAAFPAAARVDLRDAPSRMTAADLNGDGAPDLATANGAFETISVLTNDGRGTFTVTQNVVTSTTLTQLNDIAAADFDGDSRLDLVASRRFYGNVTVLRNNGDGTFGPPTDIAVSGQSSFHNSVTAADLNGDGRPDLIVADNGDAFVEADRGRIAILLNQGAGTFGSPLTLLAGDSPVGVAAADLDGDGDLDLAVANDLSHSVSVFLNQGDATFVPAEEIGVGQEPVFVAPADFDGDGDLDLAVSNFKSDTVSILLNNGVGSFTVGG